MTKKPNKLFAVFGIFAILVILTGVIFLVLALFFDKNENIEVSNEKNLTISKDFEIKFYDKDFSTLNLLENAPLWDGDFLDKIFLKADIKDHKETISKYVFILVSENDTDLSLEVNINEMEKLFKWEWGNNLINYKSGFISDDMNVHKTEDFRGGYTIFIKKEKNYPEKQFKGDIHIEVFTSEDGEFHKENKVKELILKF